MSIFSDNCNGVPRIFRPFLEIHFFAVYPSILEWVDTLVCFIEPDHAFNITFKIRIKESQILYMGNISKSMQYCRN